MSTKLGECHVVGSSTIGSNEISYGFGLTEVELSVEEGTLSKFTRLCLLASKLNETLDDSVHNETGAMARDFDGIFACIAVGGSEKAEEDFVNNGARRVGYSTEMEGLSFSRCKELMRGRCEEDISDSDGLGTADADDTEGSARWGGRGTNCGSHES